MGKRMPIGEFAKLAGVSQRALRFYEEKGMLTPSFISESGRRYYEEKDLVPLQQIMSFKYLGFPLEEIKSFLSEQNVTLKDSLLLQKQAMEQKRDHIQQMIKAIDHAVEILRADEPIDPQVFSFLIQSIVTEKQQMEWMSEYFPETTINHIKQQFADKDKELEWNTRSAILFQKMKHTIAKHSLESDEVQGLVEQLMVLIQELFGNDWSSLHQISDRLENAELPSYFGSPFTEEEEELLMEACEYYMEKKGLLTDEED